MTGDCKDLTQNCGHRSMCLASSPFPGGMACGQACVLGCANVLTQEIMLVIAVLLLVLLLLNLSVPKRAVNRLFLHQLIVMFLQHCRVPKKGPKSAHTQCPDDGDLP